MATILEALEKLDGNNINHWTATGLPRLETMKFFTGDQSLTREMIEQEAPGFTRDQAAKLEVIEVVETLDSNESEELDTVEKSKVLDVLETTDELELTEELDPVNVEELKTQLEATQVLIAEAREKMNEAGRVYHDLVDTEYKLADAIKAATGRTDDGMTAITDYLAAQSRHEAELAEKRKEFLNSGAKELLEKFKAFV